MCTVLLVVFVKMADFQEGKENQCSGCEKLKNYVKLRQKNDL